MKPHRIHRAKPSGRRLLRRDVQVRRPERTCVRCAGRLLHRRRLQPVGPKASPVSRNHRSHRYTRPGCIPDRSDKPGRSRRSSSDRCWCRCRSTRRRATCRWSGGRRKRHRHIDSPLGSRCCSHRSCRCRSQPACRGPGRRTPGIRCSRGCMCRFRPGCRWRSRDTAGKWRPCRPSPRRLPSSWRSARRWSGRGSGRGDLKARGAGHQEGAEGARQRRACARGVERRGASVCSGALAPRDLKRWHGFLQSNERALAPVSGADAKRRGATLTEKGGLDPEHRAFGRAPGQRLRPETSVLDEAGGDRRSPIVPRHCERHERRAGLEGARRAGAEMIGWRLQLSRPALRHGGRERLGPSQPLALGTRLRREEKAAESPADEDARHADPPDEHARTLCLGRTTVNRPPKRLRRVTRRLDRAR